MRTLVRSTFRSFASAAFLGLAFCAGAVQAASSKIVYQGQLRENGVPVTDEKPMAFRIFTSSAGGAAAWSSGAQTVSVENGLFRVLLQPAGVNWESPLYMEVEVGGTTLSPREELTASPYAVNALYLSGKAYTTAASAPASPGAGDLWFDTSAALLNVWTGTSWDSVLGGASASITNANIASNAAIELSKLEKDPSLTGAINTSTNPVDWSQLKNVPAAFADGVDNLGAGAPAALDGGSVVDAGAAVFNFSGAQFELTSAPAGQANIALSASSVTLQGNSFNAANELVRLNASVALPAVSAANLTNLPAAQLSGTVPNAALDGSSVTQQGNSFNGAGELVRLDASGRLAISGWDTISQHMSATKLIDFGATAADSCDSDTIGVAGAADGDVVALGVPSALAASDPAQIFNSYVSSPGVVTVRRCNPHEAALGTALSNPAAATIRVDVWKHP